MCRTHRQYWHRPSRAFLTPTQLAGQVPLLHPPGCPACARRNAPVADARPVLWRNAPGADAGPVWWKNRAPTNSSRSAGAAVSSEARHANTRAWFQFQVRLLFCGSCFILVCYYMNDCSLHVYFTGTRLKYSPEM
jgi:hypothetical protein